jgi:hypothetical protein
MVVRRTASGLPPREASVNSSLHPMADRGIASDHLVNVLTCEESVDGIREVTEVAHSDIVAIKHENGEVAVVKQMRSENCRVCPTRPAKSGKNIQRD